MVFWAGIRPLKQIKHAVKIVIAYGILKIKMKRTLGARGYTVIETMIFLIVSAGLFAGAVAGYSSRQRAVEFNQGVRDFQSRLQDTINEVATGYYPSVGSNRCFAPNNFANEAPYFLPPSTIQGTCVYLGKVIAVGLSPNCTTDGNTCNLLNSFPVVARRDFYTTATAKDDVDNFNQAKPIGLAECVGCTGTQARPDLSELVKLPNNIIVYRVFVRDVNGNINQGKLEPSGATQALEIGAISFMTALNRNNASFGRLDATNSVDMVWLPVGFAANSEVKSREAVEKLASIDSDITYINPAHGITFCLDGDGQKSSITVGATNRQLDVAIQSSDARDPGCIL